MTTMAARANLVDDLAALLRGERVAWSELGVTPEQLLAALDDEDLTGLVHAATGDSAEPTDWPAELREELARRVRAVVATELLRQRETATVLDALGARGIEPILLKGTALAYSIYRAPSLRPRRDNDLLIRREQVDATRHVMDSLGYTATNYSEGELLFRQFEFGKQDAFGVGHAFDFHWQVSTQTAFADLLTCDELAAEAAAIPALGAHARGAGLVHALLLACVHPAMHHQNVERLIWVHDVHLLLERMRAEELDRFVDLAIRKGVAAICAQALTRARSRLGTRVSEAALWRLGEAAGETTAVYLEPHRRWRDELISNVGGLRHWSDRLRLLREVAFPSPAYMLRSYGLTNRAIGTALLPALYLHRGARGAWKVLTGKK